MNELKNRRQEDRERIGTTRVYATQEMIEFYFRLLNRYHCIRLATLCSFGTTRVYTTQEMVEFYFRLLNHCIRLATLCSFVQFQNSLLVSVEVHFGPVFLP